jgi:hypothetical protein
MYINNNLIYILFTLTITYSYKIIHLLKQNNFIKNKNLDNRFDSIKDTDWNMICAFIGYTSSVINNLTIEGVGNRISETILMNMYNEKKPVESVIEKEKVINPLKKKKKTHKYKDNVITITL